MKRIIAIIIILVAGLLIFVTINEEWSLTSLTEAEPSTPPESKFISEEGIALYTTLNSAWHNPHHEESLSSLINHINNIEDEELKEYCAVTAAIGCRLQERKPEYRRIESFLDRAYPNGSHQNVLTRSYLGETCTQCQGSATAEGECDTCGGSGECRVSRCESGRIPIDGGAIVGEDSYRCINCGGTGECQDCGGTGTMIKRCPRCRGTGTEAVTDESVIKRYREFITDTINYGAEQGKIFTRDVTYRNGELNVR